MLFFNVLEFLADGRTLKGLQYKDVTVDSESLLTDVSWKKSTFKVPVIGQE